MINEPPNIDVPLSYAINKSEDVVNIVIDDRILSNVNYPTQNFLDFFRHHVSDILFNVLYKLPEIPKMSIFLAHAIQVLTSKNKDIRNVMTEDENLFKIILDFPKHADETSPVARGCYCKVLEQVIIMSDYDYLSKIKDGQPFLRSLLDNTYFTSVFDFLMNFVSTCVFSIIMFLENNSFTDLLLEYAFAEKCREQSLRIADQLTAKLPRNLPLVKPLLDPNIMLKLLDLGFSRHSCAALEVILSVHSQPHPLSRPMINAINNEYIRICNFILNTKKFDKFGILLIYLLISIVNDIYCPIENYVQVEPVKIDYSTKKSLPKTENKEAETDSNETKSSNTELPKNLSKIQKEDILKKSLIIKKRVQKSRKSFRNSAKLNLDEFALTRRSLDPSEVMHIHMQVPNINEDDEIDIENEDGEDQSLSLEIKKRENHSNHRRRFNRSNIHDHDDFLMRRNRRMNLIRRPASFSTKVQNEEGKFGQPIYDRTKDHDNEINRININYHSSDNLPNMINNGKQSISFSNSDSEDKQEDNAFKNSKLLNELDNNDDDVNQMNTISKDQFHFQTINKEPEKYKDSLDAISEEQQEENQIKLNSIHENNHFKLDTITEDDKNHLGTITEEPEVINNQLESIKEENQNQLHTITEEPEENDPFILDSIAEENENHLCTITEEPEQNNNQLVPIAEEPEHNQNHLSTITEEDENNHFDLEPIKEEPEQNSNQLESIAEEPEQNQNHLSTITEEDENDHFNLEPIKEEPEQNSNQLELIAEEPEHNQNHLSTITEEPDENKDLLDTISEETEEENENQLETISEESEENGNQLLETISEESEENPNQLGTISEENENNLETINEEPHDNYLETISEEPNENSNHLGTISEEPEENGNQLETINEEPHENYLETISEESEENGNQLLETISEESEENPNQLDTISEESEENGNQLLETISEESEENPNQLETISEESEENGNQLLETISEESEENPNQLEKISEESDENGNHLETINEEPHENHLETISEDPDSPLNHLSSITEEPDEKSANNEQKSVRINRNQFPHSIKPNLLRHHRQKSCGTPTVRDPVHNLNISIFNENHANNQLGSLSLKASTDDESNKTNHIPNYLSSPLTAILEDERFRPHSNILPSPSVNTESFSLSKLPSLIQEGSFENSNSAPNSSFSSPIKSKNLENNKFSNSSLTLDSKNLITDFTNLRGGECPTPPAQSFSPFNNNNETKKPSIISEAKSSTNNINLNLNINLKQESKPLNSSQQQFYNRRHSTPYKFIPRSIPFPEKSSSSSSVSSSSSREDNQLENNDEENNDQLRPPPVKILSSKSSFASTNSSITPRRFSQPLVKQNKNQSSDNEEEKYSFPTLNTSNHISNTSSSFNTNPFISTNNKSSLPITTCNSNNKNNIIRSELVFHPFSLLSGDRNKIRNSSPAVSFTRNTDNLQSPITTDPKTGEKLSLLDFAIQGSQHCKSKELIRPTPLQISTPTNNINNNNNDIHSDDFSIKKKIIDNEIQFSAIDEIDELEHHHNNNNFNKNEPEKKSKTKEEEEKLEKNNQLNEDEDENDNDDCENQLLDNEEIIKTLVFLINAFFENKTNSFLHNSVIQLLTSLFDYTSMTAKIITEAQLPKRILEMYSNKDKIRASFWGQLHLMAEFIKSTPEVIPNELKDKWDSYIENKYNRDETIMENSYGYVD